MIAQLVQCIQSLEETTDYLGKELYKLKNKVKELVSEIEDLKPSLPKGRASEGSRDFKD